MPQNPFFGSGMPGGFDPSKMDPKLLMELSQLIQQLPQEHLQRMQTLMHNAMAGFDVTREMAEFEKALPAGFRERLMGLMLSQGGGANPSAPIEVESGPTAESPSASEPLDVKSARLTILRGVAEGQISPEEAERLLFT